MIQASSLSQEIKDNATLLHHFNLAGLSIGKKDYVAAKTHAEEFRQGAEASKNPAQVKQSHELAGRIALAEKDYDKAIAELEQANQQDPHNLYRLGQAYQGKGESAKARGFYGQAAGFNSLSQLNYSFIRRGAKDGGRQDRLTSKKSAENIPYRPAISKRPNGQVLDLAAGLFTTGGVSLLYQLRPAPAAMA
jgi:tetratricopeptide (TPR) repeat protein